MNLEVTRMMYPQLRQEWDRIRIAAKPRMGPRCVACEECNSARPRCKFVSSDRGKSGIRNYDKLNDIKLAADTIYAGGNGDEIDSSFDFFGHKMRAPVFNAPIAWIKNVLPNTRFKKPDVQPIDGYATDSDDYSYNKALIGGCADVGSIGWVGDSKHHPQSYFYDEGLQVIKEYNGLGIPTIKSWDDDKLIDKIKQAQDVNSIAIAVDIDCVGLGYMSINGKYDRLPGLTNPKSASQLKETFSDITTPYLLKGIMTPQGAVKAIEAGAAGIVISNHAGNNLDQSLATIEVLEPIKRAVGDDIMILIDGGFRHGEDVFKAIALGADGVLIGRPVVIAAEGAEAYGVSIYLQKIIWELQNAMRMTGCLTLKDITKDKVYITKDF